MRDLRLRPARAAAAVRDLEAVVRARERERRALVMEFFAEDCLQFFIFGTFCFRPAAGIEKNCDSAV